MTTTAARKLRKIMTRQEVKLWRRLRELRAVGYHFGRQSPLLPFVVDFECHRSRIVVEVDGHQHGHDEHRERDRIRDRELEKRGYKVLRFSSGEIDQEMDGVLESIGLALGFPHPAASRPPSPGGEG